MKKHYVNDTELTYEIILSQGKGNATEKLKMDLYKISVNLNLKFYYYDPNDRYDTEMDAFIALMENYHKFDYNRYNKSLPYLSEIAKRRMAQYFNRRKFKGMIGWTQDPKKEVFFMDFNLRIG